MKTLIYSILSISSLVLLSSCGTIGGLLSKGERPVFLIEAPQDMTVNFEGQSKDISSEAFASTGFNNTTITYYTSAVNLPYKHKGTLKLSSSTGSSSIELKPKGQRAIWWGNFILFPIWGHIIDATTKNNKTLFPRYIDVPAALAGKPVKEWRSAGQLKRLSKKQARG